MTVLCIRVSWLSSRRQHFAIKGIKLDIKNALICSFRKDSLMTNSFFFSCSISVIIVCRLYRDKKSEVYAKMGDSIHLANTTVTDDENSHSNSCNLGCAAQSLNQIDGYQNDFKYTLWKVYMKAKLMKGLLIVIPVATVILIILLIVKRKREARYQERRKFWFQAMSIRIQ